jgi:hypothetical protein
MTTPGNESGLEKFYLNDDEWDMLKDFADILEVCLSFHLFLI